VIPDEVMQILKAHDWPGNIRELENTIERAVVLSPGPVLRPTLTDLRQMSKQPTSAAAQTLVEASREHILEVLEQTRWMIGGRHGAAERLGLPRTTLIYKMRKHGIGPRRTHQSRHVTPIGLDPAPPRFQAAAAC
jgi:transcriptional regulator of acetoin/glycerol metabolism